jgi:hypothetical protein
LNGVSELIYGHKGVNGFVGPVLFALSALIFDQNIDKYFHGAVEGPARLGFESYNAPLRNGEVEGYVIDRCGYDDAPAMAMRRNGRTAIHPRQQLAPKEVA